MRALWLVLAAAAAIALWQWSDDDDESGNRDPTPIERSPVIENGAPVAPGRRARPALPPPTEPPRAAPEPPGDGVARPADRVVAMSQRQLARQAYQAGDHKRALSQAQAVLAVRPGDRVALRLAAVASCKLGLADRAQEHADKLDRRRFEQVQRQCAEDGIELRHPYEPSVPDGGAAE